MLASASDAIIIGFNVRPAGNARQLADKEEIDIRYYSIIYAIDDLKDAMEGMLAPEMKEEVLGTAEIREIFKISKVDLLQVVW
jgi:translation initiation factor IF-2